MLFFFFNDTATTEIYTLSLHDALPIWHQPAETARGQLRRGDRRAARREREGTALRRPSRHSDHAATARGDRKSTRLNSSHGYISYAVFCLKKKKTTSMDILSGLCE